MNYLEAFNELKANITVFVSPIFNLKVTNRNEMESASMALRELKRREKMVEEQRKELVGPLNDKVKMINEYCKEIAIPLGKADFHLKEELKNFEKILEVERQAKLKAEYEERVKREAEAQEKIRIAKEEAETAAMFATTEGEAELAQAQAHAEAERIAFEAKKAGWDAKKEIMSDKVRGATKRWVVKVIDGTKVPHEYWKIDESLLRQAVTKEGVREIPGCEITQEVTISAR